MDDEPHAFVLSALEFEVSALGTKLLPIGSPSRLLLERDSLPS